jgi:hypothetical protein
VGARRVGCSVLLGGCPVVNRGWRWGQWGNPPAGGGEGFRLARMLRYHGAVMIDIAEARRQCQLFIAEMSDNRPNCDDAGVARKILIGLDRRGQVDPRTRARLTRWCHTNGSLYRRGVPIAEAISMALYGRILPREE